MILILPDCASALETDRSQLRLIGADQEMQLGLAEFDKLKQSIPTSKDI